MQLQPLSRCLLLGAALLGALAWSVPVDAARTQQLFFIARSTNRNLVRYDVRMNSRGELDTAEPMLAYWIMREQGGRREGLTWLERELAYGYEVLPPVSRSGFRLELTAYDRRVIHVRRIGGAYRAELPIAGRTAVLGRIHVAVRQGGLRPTMLYVQLHGRDAETGRALTERIRPD